MIQLQLFKPRLLTLLTWQSLCGTIPARWDFMDGIGFMPRDDEGYALVDSRDVAKPTLHRSTWGMRWGKL